MIMQTQANSDIAAAAHSPAPAISVRNLRMGYGARVLLDGVSFDVRRGEIVVILGGSGSGKSSLMKCIIGLYEPMAGDIVIDGHSLVTASAEEKAQLQRKLGVMYQSGALFGSLNVLENVRFPLDQFTDLTLEHKNLTARMLLDQVEMAYAEALMPAELSGGMLKRAGIARAMALGCDILLLDEPSAGLDPITAANLDRTILSLRKHLGCRASSQSPIGRSCSIRSRAASSLQGSRPTCAITAATRECVNSSTASPTRTGAERSSTWKKASVTFGSVRSSW
jgi:phospholipid/cholesterol/gamma-HCH transport system ATP-binding protein